ncbi:DUF1631 domain-containing protein [Aurantivibrio infirmus]
MSDFYKDSENNSIGHYPDAFIVESLKACQKICIARSEELFKSYSKILDEKLLEFIDSAKTDKEATQIQETVREFRTKNKELTKHFCGHLGEGFIKFKKRQLNTRTGEEKYRGDMLSLVDNEDLEETIALSSVAHRAEEHYGEELWFLNQRFAALNDGDKVSESNNPVSPVQFCEALRKALKVLSINTKSKIIAYKIFDKEFITKIDDILREINLYLSNKNILPNLRYTMGQQNKQPEINDLPLPGYEDPSQQQPPAHQQPAGYQHPPQAAGVPPSYLGQQPLPPSRFVATPDPNRSAEEYQGRLVDAIRTLQNHIGYGQGQAQAIPTAAPANAANYAPNSPQVASAGGAAAPGGYAQAPIYSNQQMVTALHGLQTQASSFTAGLADTPTGEFEPVTPQAIAAVNLQLADELKKETEDGLVDPLDMHTIELVGMLFEYMLSDDNLPDSIKAILSYLHTPFLKVAFVDPSFFEKTEHPARLLLNSLAEAGVKWVSNDGSSQYEIYTKIKHTVSRVLEEFEKDVKLFAELLLEFSSYSKKIARRQELMEKRAMEKVQGEEKLREVKIQVNKEVRSRTDGKELPSAVLLLLLQPWSDYLAFVLLRYGDESETWKKAIAAVDDVLWSIEPKVDVKDKSRQSELMDDLLDVIEAGFETIGYDQNKGRKLIEAVVSLQKIAMQSQQVEAAPAEMRADLETKAAEKAGDSDQEDDQATPEEEKLVEHLKMIEFGTWFEFEGGKRLKVAWYNSKTLHYMLVDQMGKKVAMKSGLELARSMLSGAARVIAGSTKPFFERALENIYQNLNAKAESSESDSVAPEADNGGSPEPT